MTIVVVGCRFPFRLFGIVDCLHLCFGQSSTPTTQDRTNAPVDIVVGHCVQQKKWSMTIVGIIVTPGRSKDLITHNIYLLATGVAHRVSHLGDSLLQLVATEEGSGQIDKKDWTFSQVWIRNGVVVGIVKVILTKVYHISRYQASIPIVVISDAANRFVKESNLVVSQIRMG